MVEQITNINSSINGFVWGIPVLSLLIGTGVLMTTLTRGFQVSHFSHWMAHTIGAVFKKESGVTDKSDQHAISQFQSLCTALAATIGVGNIAGVATAIAVGGPGTIFWMWVAAFFGMMTNYSENVLGIYYRIKNKEGDWCGGAMYYLRDGLGAKPGCKGIGGVLATLFSFFCIMASFGIGNASQINTISGNMKTVFAIPTVVTGVVLMVIAGLVIVGGIKRIASVTEKLVPFMAIVYVLGALIIFMANIGKTGEVLTSIFTFAFGLRAIGGAVLGIAVRSAVTWGFKRGVFSNEAGLGSSVMVHSASNVKEPVHQGMWGIFEVFADTIVVCSLTAFAILSSGVVNLETGAMNTAAEKSALVSQAFSSVFGPAGAVFIAIAILLFAFSTVLGWSYYGTKAWEFLFGTKSTIYYKIVFVLFIVVGATMSLDLAWDISDTFNGLMAIPNLIGVVTLSPVVMKITKNYVARNIRGEAIEPMLSNHEEIQEEHKRSLNVGLGDVLAE